MARFVIAHRNDRLGTKLQTVVSAGRIAKKIGAKLLIAWDRKKNSLNTRNIFSDDFCEPYEEGKSSGNFISSNLIEEWRPNAKFHEKGVIDPAAVKNSEVLLFDKPAILKFSEESEDEIKNECISYWNGIPLNRTVTDRLDAFIGTCGLGDYIGVHIRRGDIVGNIRKLPVDDSERLNRFCTQFLNRFVYDDAYFSAIDEIREQRKMETGIFLCSDTQSIFKKYIKKYGIGRIAHLDSEFTQQYPDQAALLDMLLLARTNTIVSGGSYFAQFAANISHANWIDLRNTYDWRKAIEEARHLIRERDAHDIGLISGVLCYQMARRLRFEKRLADALDAISMAIDYDHSNSEYKSLQKNILERKARH
jgi:hypothetical protein